MDAIPRQFIKHIAHMLQVLFGGFSGAGFG